MRAINYHTFSYWIKCYRSTHNLGKGERLSVEHPQNEFIPLEIDASTDISDEAIITLHYPNGVRLHLDRISLTRETVVSLQKLITCLD